VLVCWIRTTQRFAIEKKLSKKMEIVSFPSIKYLKLTCPQVELLKSFIFFAEYLDEMKTRSGDGLLEKEENI